MFQLHLLLFNPYPVYYEKFIKLYFIFTPNKLHYLRNYIHFTFNQIGEFIQITHAFKSSESLAVSCAKLTELSF